MRLTMYELLSVANEYVQAELRQATRMKRAANLIPVLSHGSSDWNHLLAEDLHSLC